MHFLRKETYSLDEQIEAVDLAQSPAEIVILSFTDSDLSALAAAFAARNNESPSIRLANLSRLRHPFSVDLYIEQTCAQARFVLVRLLGGVDYWRYGVEQLAVAARKHGFSLALIPGDRTEDPRLDEASTLSSADLRLAWTYFHHGGPANMGRLLGWIGVHIGYAGEILSPIEVPSAGMFEAACHAAPADAPSALIVFYRSMLMAGDVEPVAALAQALNQRGFAVTTVFVTSLKDTDVHDVLASSLESCAPDIILNATAFSARLDGIPGILESANAPIFQIILAGAPKEQWEGSIRGLSASDLAMNVVLPEVDGRIITRAISFKAKESHQAALEFTSFAHRAEPGRITFVATLAEKWVKLRRTAPENRRIACILSDYPAKGGRVGHAVGLDTPASVLSIAGAMRTAQYDIPLVLPDAVRLMQCLTSGEKARGPNLGEYRRWFQALPEVFRDGVLQHWGDPLHDPAVMDGAFHYHVYRAGKLLIAMQPDRGNTVSRQGEYHDQNLPPRHAYIAFYLWLRQTEAIDAMIHCGAHGTLEFLPGKSVALSENCAPEVVLGPVPVIYPFIVNNPGEAAQAKRRLGAVIISHLTPALTVAENHGATCEMEALFDEYANAEMLDRRRARHLSEAILARAVETGLATESGIDLDEDPMEALSRLGAWLCDLKEMRIRDGLHIFGQPLSPEQYKQNLAACETLSLVDSTYVEKLFEDSARLEIENLLAALDGEFVAPGPGGPPSRGRLDVLPTGRNIYSVDPRNIPTRTAWEIGRRTAAEVMTRYAQDHGAWPKTIVMDLWGSATMRTGGDEIAQAFALLGVSPHWDEVTSRVLGFDIILASKLERPRVDVTLRISGLFRDVFPAQIALLDQAIRAVAALDEADDINPLAAGLRCVSTLSGNRESAASRIFGAAPSQYGTGVSQLALTGKWDRRDELGAAYLDATTFAYGGAEANATEAAGEFRIRVGAADAFVHVQDMAEQDILDSDTFAEHEGGFVAAAGMLGASPALYHADTSMVGRMKVRTLREEIARVVRARAINPKWIAGQMRHGFRGAGEMAEVVDNLFAFAATTDAVESRYFDLIFDAYCDDDDVRSFLMSVNPEAAKAIALRLEEAQRRGFWQTQRNSAVAHLSQMQKARYGELARKSPSTGVEQ